MLVFSVYLGYSDLNVALFYFVSLRAFDSAFTSSLSLLKGEFYTFLFILSQCFPFPKVKLLAARSVNECLMLCLSI